MPVPLHVVCRPCRRPGVAGATVMVDRPTGRDTWTDDYEARNHSISIVAAQSQATIQPIKLCHMISSLEQGSRNPRHPTVEPLAASGTSLF
jgi:hypothetical protein